MANACYIGIDGGGTRTVGVALDRDGHVLCRAEEKSINYCSVGMSEAVGALSRIVSVLQKTAACPAMALAVGSSALDERVRDELYDDFCNQIDKDPTLSAIPTRIIKSDAFMALAALGNEERGAILISGTGMMGLASNQGALQTVGGWGDVFGDRGSGYAIGLGGLICALDYADGLNPAGEALFLAACEFYSLSTAADLIAKVYAPTFDKSKIAAFSLCVTALAEKKDAASIDLLNRAANDLADYAVALGNFLGPLPFSLGFYGSVLTKNQFVFSKVRELLKKRLPQAKITIPEMPAETAAALLAIRRTHA